MSEGVDFFYDIYSTAMTGFILPSILDLNIAESLVSGPKTILELTQDTSVNPDRLQRFLQQLESTGIFSYDQVTCRWSNNEKSSYFLDKIPKSMIQLIFSSFYIEIGKDFDKVLHSNKNLFEINGRQPFFDEIKKDKRALKLFQEGMQAMTKANSQNIINAIDLSVVQKLLDVGGGNGTLIMELVSNYTWLKGAVYERPEIAEIAEKNIEAAEMSEKIDVMEGSFFENVPCGYDAILMKYILHDWPDDECLNILRNCRDALQVGNKLFIVDIVVDRNSKYYKRHTVVDIRMMTILNAKERTQLEFKKLLEQTGFKFERNTEAGYQNVIEATAI